MNESKQHRSNSTITVEVENPPKGRGPGDLMGPVAGARFEIRDDGSRVVVFADLEANRMLNRGLTRKLRGDVEPR